MHRLSHRTHDHLNRHPHVEQLESKRLLAGDLIASWSADDLDDSLTDNRVISSWTDSVSGTENSFNDVDLENKYTVKASKAYCQHHNK